ncbi:MAG: hypothetical protein SNJ67_06250 [Chloracidobacterium sp.]|uniref:Uncharacterized protein n=1 Tax=Chloracidobacterium validum TaxID=2821543 RepID=A0ABX8BHC1_9BACT|nr:hypothetical protein [Chloracidobacterium validum]QUW04485.1 hypothetical protein J8C06_11895 [Chloracidobacterium validum]
MSKHKYKEEKPREEKLKDKRKDSAPTIFENVVEQATERWEQLVHNPQFAAALATALEQPMNLANRVQELVGASLRTMNILTRDDYKKLSRQLDEIAGQLEHLSERLEEISERLPAAAAPTAAAAGRRAASSGTTPRKASRSRKKADGTADSDSDTTT